MSLLSKTDYKLTEYAAETMVYFERHKLIEIAKKILVECALERPQDAKEWIGKNLKRIASEIYSDCLSAGENGTVKSLHMSRNFLNRIVLFGRPGSGRKTQACNLVATFNLVLSMQFFDFLAIDLQAWLFSLTVDADMLIYQCLRGDDDRPYDPLDRELQRAFYYDNCWAKSKALLNIIARRLLEKDCLSCGWVIINFPHTLEDFKDILDNFKIPPNKLIYLKCPEKTCIKRLINMPKLGKPSQYCKYYEEEMRFFNRHECEINNYLLKRCETICVDAEPLSVDVKKYIFSSILKTPYVIGLNRNTRD